MLAREKERREIPDAGVADRCSDRVWAMLPASIYHFEISNSESKSNQENKKVMFLYSSVSMTYRTRATISDRRNTSIAA
jgi:hypothetical protein